LTLLEEIIEEEKICAQAIKEDEAKAAQEGLDDDQEIVISNQIAPIDSDSDIEQ
jgi:hypothetical protein